MLYKKWDKKWKNSNIKESNNFAKRVVTYVNKDKKVEKILDLGSGVGRDSIYFFNKGYKVTAVDFSIEALSILHENEPNVKCKLGDVSKINFSKDSFDVVYAHLSLHYFDDKTTRKIFKKILNILKPGGYLFVKCKSVDDALYGVGKKIESDMYQKKGEWSRHFFSKKYMSEILEDFQIIKLRKSTSVYHSYKSSFIESFARK